MVSDDTELPGGRKMWRPQVTESGDVSLERPSGIMQFSLLLPCFTCGETKAQGVLDAAWEV